MERNLRSSGFTARRARGFGFPPARSPSYSPTSKAARPCGSSIPRRWRPHCRSTTPPCARRSKPMGAPSSRPSGDAFQAAFPTAPQALKAAIEGQRALAVRRLERAGAAEGAHGPAHRRGRAGPRRGRVRRLAHQEPHRAHHSAAHGGQILLSQETADLVVAHLPEGVSLKDLGEHRLKGMAMAGAPVPGVRARPAAGFPAPGNRHHPPQQPAPPNDLFHRKGD